MRGRLHGLGTFVSPLVQCRAVSHCGGCSLLRGTRLVRKASSPFSCLYRRERRYEQHVIEAFGLGRSALFVDRPVTKPGHGRSWFDGRLHPELANLMV